MYRFCVLTLSIIILITTCYIVLSFVFVLLLILLLLFELFSVISIWRGSVLIHPVNVLFVLSFFLLVCGFTFDFLCFFGTYDVALYFCIPLLCYFLYSCLSFLLMCFVFCLKPFFGFLCNMLVCVCSDYSYNTMLTAVPLFLTFLPIMSVCFVQSSLSIQWNLMRLSYKCEV